jgi:hypothetical protein
MLTRLRTTATAGVVRLRDRTRGVARRVFTITQLSRQAKQEPVAPAKLAKRTAVLTCICQESRGDRPLARK